MTCGNENTAFGLLPKYAHFDDDCHSTADPMNILFLNESPQGLERTIRQIDNIDTGKRWGPPAWWFVSTARDQHAQIDGSCKEQDDQWVAGDIWDRFHIRIWAVPGGNVIAGAHHENLLSIGGNPPWLHGHWPDSFDSGKVTICADFRSIGKTVADRKSVV